jgi:hypothetical protein
MHVHVCTRILAADSPLIERKENEKIQKKRRFYIYIVKEKQVGWETARAQLRLPGRSGPSGWGEADYGLLLAGPWSESSSFECAAVRRSENLATGKCIPIDPRYQLLNCVDFIERDSSLLSREE